MWFLTFKIRYKRDKERCIHFCTSCDAYTPSSVKNMHPLRLLALMLQTQRLYNESEETSELAKNCLAHLSATFQPRRLSHTVERPGELHGLQSPRFLCQLWNNTMSFLYTADVSAHLLRWQSISCVIMGLK